MRHSDSRFCRRISVWPGRIVLVAEATSTPLILGGATEKSGAPHPLQYTVLLRIIAAIRAPIETAARKALAGKIPGIRRYSEPPKRSGQRIFPLARLGRFVRFVGEDFGWVFPIIGSGSGVRPKSPKHLHPAAMSAAHHRRTSKPFSVTSAWYLTADAASGRSVDARRSGVEQTRGGTLPATAKP
jgi:hypothetical protein